MKSEDIFPLGLGLSSPWEVKAVHFEETKDGKELHIHIDFNRGSCFANDKGEMVKAYDTEEKEWRHLNFFEHLNSATLLKVSERCAPKPPRMRFF